MRRSDKAHHSRWHDWLRNLAAGGVLLLLYLAFFWRTLSGDVYQPADGGDLLSFLFPTYRFAASELSAGRLPLWNPTLYGGAPFIGDIQAGFLYGPNLLLFWLDPTFPYPALQWLAVLHLFWAGLGMYVLLRTLPMLPQDQTPSVSATEGRLTLGVSRPAALFAGLAFGLSDPLLIHLGNLNLVAVLSWLPWVLAAATRALNARSLRSTASWTALAAVLFAVSTYAGHAQSTLYVGLALALYLLVWLLERGLRQSWLRVVAIGSGVLLLTLLLAAPLLWPALEMARHTVRTDFTYQDAVAYSLAPVQGIIGLITPSFFGRGPALHWSLWQRVELPYLGVATLILAVAAPLLAAPAQRRKLWGWLAIALFGLLVSLGVYGLLHGLLTLVLPLFDQFRAPARALILWSLGMCVLAAVGFDLVVNAATQNLNAKKFNAKTPRGKGAKEPNPEAQAHVGVLTGRVGGRADPHVGGRTGRMRTGRRAFDALLRWGAILLLFIALPLSFLALLLTQGDATAFLRASLASLAVALAAACWLGTWAIIASRRRGAISAGVAAGLLIGLLFFDLAASGAYTDISGSDPAQGFQHPEIVAFLRADPDLFRIDTDTDIAALWQPDTAALYGLQDVSGVANPLLLRSMRDFQQSTGGRGTRRYDLLNVKYVLVRAGTPLPEGKFVRVLGPVGELEVYENRQFAPRAWWSPADVDLANLELPDAPVAAEVTSYANSAMTVTVDAPAAGYVVLSETWYRGWRAMVNGVVTPIEQVNGVFRAVRVPAGHSVVEMKYWPWTLE